MTEPPPRPLPLVDTESGPFWAAAHEHRLVAQRCGRCATVFHYPRALCPRCHSADLAWQDLAGTGAVHTFTITRRASAPAFESAVPFVVALVDLDEGPRMMGNVRDVDPESVRIGQRVRVAFDDVTPQISLPYFVPDPRTEEST